MSFAMCICLFKDELKTIHVLPSASTDGVVKTTVKFKYPCTDKAAAEKAIKDEMVKEHGKKAMCLDKDRKVDAKCAATFKIDCTSRRRRRRKRATATSSVELNTK